MSVKANRIAPWELDNGEAGHSPADYRSHFLAEGDSWFSFGSFLGNSLLNQLWFAQRTLITQTAMPGDTMGHMVDWFRDANFTTLIDGGRHGSRAWRFDAILLSGGGNDLIDAISDQYVDRRLLALCSATSPPESADECIHWDAWHRFERYLRANFRTMSEFVGNSVKNTQTPIFVHTYDVPTPRARGTGFGPGPWIGPALAAHRVPVELWVAVTDLLFNRLAGVIRDLRLANVTVVDTAGTLVRAPFGSTGEPEHWLNEIHPNGAGYRLLGRQWTEAIERRLGAGD
jgi:lysophospholipase L1-like esterase